MRAVLLVAALASLASAQPFLSYQWKQRPTLSAGDNFSLEFRSRFQSVSLPPSDDPDGNGIFVRTARIGIQGSFLRNFEYEVEYDFAKEDHPWRDVSINWKASRALELRGGRFKIPFSLEQLQRPVDLDFIFRAQASSLFAPARSTGVEAHGKLFGKLLTYQTGVFAGAGDNAAGGGPTYAARGVLAPLTFLGRKSRWGNLQVGGSASLTQVGEGLYSLRGKDEFGVTWFPRLFVKGLRRRAGVEAEYNVARLHLQSEWVGVSEQRAGQGLLGDNLAPLHSSAWYATAMWRFRTLPKKAREQFHWPGGWEAGARWEEASFRGGDPAYTPSRSPRARSIFPNHDSILTLGVNWQPSKLFRIQTNILRETFDDVLRGAQPLAKTKWVPLVQLQFVL